MKLGLFVGALCSVAIGCSGNDSAPGGIGNIAGLAGSNAGAASSSAGGGTGDASNEGGAGTSAGTGGAATAGAAALGGAGGSAAGTGGIGGGSVCGALAEAAYPHSTFTPDASTVAWYQLNDVSDSGAQGLALTNNGQVTLSAQGVDWSRSATNGVAHFNGGEQSLSRAGLTVGNDFTLDTHVFWRGFRNRACGAPSQIVALTNGKAGVVFGQACGVAAGPRVRVNDTTDMVTTAQLEDAVDNAWHWVRFAISGGKATFLLDGKALGTSTSVEGLGSATWTLTLGSAFNGDIDEVRLSSKALAAGTAVPPTVAVRPTYTELTAMANKVSLSATTDSPAAAVSWHVVSGPGAVGFTAPSAATTDATFCAPGKYVLQAVAANGEATATDEVVVRVWPAEGRKEPYKVLFLGNSFTFYNGTVGYRVWEFAKAAGESVGDNYAASPFVKHITSPGQPFQFHWFEKNANSECTSCTDHVLPAPPTVNLTDYVGKYAQDVIADGDWDVVVLHSYSTAASRDVTNFFRYGKKLDRLIKRSGARTVFYQTWAYPGVDNTTAEEETLLGNYEKLAQQTGAALSKVGRAFKDAHAQLDAYQKFPNGILFSDDKHPSSFGTYLSAAVHFGVIYGKSPVPIKLYQGAGDISAPTIDSDKAKADQLRTIAAAYAAAKPLQNGQ